MTSLMWCEEFSMPQCPRIAAARSAGLAWWTWRLVGVDALAGLALAGLLAAAVDADGQVGVGDGDAAEFVGDGAGLDRAGLASAVPGLGGGVLDGDVAPGQGGQLAVGGGLVGLDHGDVVGLLGLDQPGDVRLDRVQCVEGDDGAGQVQRREQGLEVRGSFVFAPTST
ncbi:hypothetical protein [Streptacidiphilus rugosus]|uniref:hypothetical protein n=1 Tax=Streptacidiphilus rugosus TaxID=405783 RepID=UPI001E28C604|nr:hypothetical protein [Streptacidiphilus rugosus]